MKKASSEMIEDIWNSEYEENITVLYHAFVGYNKKNYRYLMVTEDTDDNNYLVNEILLKVKKEDGEEFFVLEDAGSMPDYSSKSLKDAKMYVNQEVQNYKKFLLNEKLQKNLPEKPKEKRLKI